MSPVVFQWVPALLILFGIVLGVIYNNRSINHLDARIGGGLAHVSTRIDDLIRNEEIRHNDLKDFIKSEVRRLEDRIEHLEHPIIRS